MKPNFFQSLSVFVLSAISLNVYSSDYYASGQVEDLLLRNTLDGYAVLYIEDFSSAGNCPIYGSKNLVVLSLKGSKAETMYSTLLAAYLAGKAVKVSTDDSYLDADGYCILKQVRLNTQF